MFLKNAAETRALAEIFGLLTGGIANRSKIFQKSACEDF
jgi:hypothetical protein